MNRHTTQITQHRSPNQSHPTQSTQPNSSNPDQSKFKIPNRPTQKSLNIQITRHHVQIAHANLSTIRKSHNVPPMLHPHYETRMKQKYQLNNPSPFYVRSCATTRITWKSKGHFHKSKDDNSTLVSRARVQCAIDASDNIHDVDINREFAKAN